jgi:hypothetical protein
MFLKIARPDRRLCLAPCQLKSLAIMTCPGILTQLELEFSRKDLTRLSKPEVVGDFGLRGSVRPVWTGGFADTVAQVSVSSKDVERSRDACSGASSGTRIAAAAAQVAAISADVRSSSAECGRWWL